MANQAELLVQQVETLNKRASALNVDRNKKLGMQEAAKVAYEKAVAIYQQKYGVTLDDTNLQSEYNAVFASLKEDATALSGTILSIENGTWQKPAEQPAVQAVVPPVAQPTPQVQSTPQVQPVAPVQPVTPAQPAMQPTGFQQQFVPQPQTPIGQQQVQPVNPNMFVQQPVAQPFGLDVHAIQPTQPPDQPVQPTQPVQPIQPQEDVSEQPFTPQGWGTPQANVDINANFVNILSGGKGVKFGTN